MFWIDKESPVPLHHQLRQSIRQEILSGRLGPGTMLPTEMDICEQLEISRTTVRTAIRDLALEGLVTRVPARGTFVAERRDTRDTIVIAAFAIPESPGPGSELFFRMWEGIERAASARGLHVAVRRSIAHVDERTKFLNRLAHEPSTLGLAVFTWGSVTWNQVRHLHDVQFPYVLLNRYIPGHQVPSVTLDDRGAVIRSVRRLYGLGHRRIFYLGLINPESTAHMDHERGYHEAMRSLGLEEEARIVRIEWRPSTMHRSIADLLRARDGCTALIVGSGDVAAGVVTEAEILGIHVPDDLSVISFEDSSRTNERPPGITTVDYEPTAIGEAVVDLIRRQAAGETTARSRHTIPISFIERGSYAALKETGAKHAR